MNQKLCAVLVMVLLIAAVSGVCKGDEEVIPPNTVGFLGGGWHPADECKQCHVSLLSKDALRAKLGSCECHREAYTTGGKIDGGKIREKAHGIPVCIDCHIGSGIVTRAGNISCDDVHRPHMLVACQDCHSERESIVIPETGSCDSSSCHPGDAHSTHGNKTGDLCVACHGSFGLKYKEEGYQLEEGVPVEKKPEEATYPTISHIVKGLIGTIVKTGKTGES